MREERSAEREGTSEVPDTGDRRQFLKYLATGTAGATAAVGLGKIAEDVDGTNSATSLPEDPQQYDALVRQRDDEYEGFEPDGATIASGGDGWAVLRTTLDSVPAGGSVHVSGRYESSSPLEVTKSIDLLGEAAVIDQRQSGEFAFEFSGDQRFRTTLAARASQGDTTLELDDTSGLQADDIILLKAEEAPPVLGRGHPPGEPHSVLSADGNTVTVADSVVWRGGYEPGTTAYVLDPITVHVSGLSLRAPAKDGNYYGLAARICRNSTFENLHLEKFGSRAILLGPSANSRVRDCTVVQSADIEAADGYGIQVWSGCHDILVEGCTAKECRHPLSVTAGGDLQVASRAITFRDCFVTGTGAGALNCHGGSAHDVRFEGCTVHTWGDPGLTTGAQQTNVSGCEFRMDGHNAVDTRGDGQECVLTVTDTDIYGATNAVKLSQESDLTFAPLWKLAHIDGVRAYGCEHFLTVSGGEIDRVRNLLVRGCYWDEVTQEGIRLRNRLDSGVIEGNTFGTTVERPHVFSGSSGQVSNLQITGNQFTQSNARSVFIKLVNARECLVSDNTFVSQSPVNIYVDGEQSTGNKITDNTYYVPNPPADPVQENTGSTATGNDVYDTAANSWR